MEVGGGGVLLLPEQLLKRRLLGSRRLENQADETDPLRGIDRSEVILWLRLGMNKASQNDIAAGVYTAGDPVRLGQ